MSESTTTAVTRGRIQGEESVDRIVADSCLCGITGESAGGSAYNEEAFRYLLAIERKRSERSNRPFFLLLVDLGAPPGPSKQIGAEVADKLFSSLSLALRETDFVGWYRESHVVGAVLTQMTGTSDAQVSGVLGQRVRDQLLECLPGSLAKSLQVRVFELSRRPRS